jgi:HSP20 family protein
MSGDVPEKKLETDVSPPQAEPQKWVRTPPIDIFEIEDGLVLRADLPGVSADALELQVQDNRLTLFGHVEQPVDENVRLLHQEYHMGDFLRSFILSDDVDHERISAKLTNGVLEVTLPKVPRPEPRRISVETE